MPVSRTTFEASVEESIIIDAPPEAVFAFASDFNNYSQISSAFYESYQTSDGPVGVGTTAVRKAYLFVRHYIFEQTVLEYDPPRRLVLRNVSPSLETTEYMSFSPNEGGTLFTLRVCGDTRSFVAISLPLILATVDSQMRKDLRNLKKLVEDKLRREK